MTNRTYDTNGWAEIKNNPISKAGVFQYSGRAIGADDPDKLYNVYRPAEELNNPDTIDSFKLLPWVDDHPYSVLGSESDGLPTADEKGVDGVIGENVYFENDTLYANIKAFTDKLASLIAAGKKELSAGFRCVYEKASGNYNGQAYDYIQRSIRGNHLALVEKGRMGPDVAVLDKFTFTFDAKELIKMEEVKKEEVVEKGADAEITLESLAELIGALSAKVDGLVKGEEAEVVGEDEEADPALDKDPAAGMDAMEKTLKSMQARIDELQSANPAKSIMATIAQRDTLAKKLAPHIGAFDHAEKTLDEVANYGISKLGIKCAKGQEVAALDGFFAGRASDGVTISLDSASKQNTSVIDAYLSGK
jgi:hypothetical protein